MNRRVFVKSSIAAGLLAYLAPYIGCGITQSQYAQLANDIGTQVAAIVALQGNTALADQITKATANAVVIIKAWKPGTPSQQVIQAINALVGLLNLVPQIGPYIPLIQLALSTIEILISDIQSQSPQVAADSHLAITHSSATPGVVGAHNRKELKARWNAICAANPQLASVVMK